MTAAAVLAREEGEGLGQGLSRPDRRQRGPPDPRGSRGEGIKWRWWLLYEPRRAPGSDMPREGHGRCVGQGPRWRGTGDRAVRSQEASRLEQGPGWPETR